MSKPIHTEEQDCECECHNCIYPDCYHTIGSLCCKNRGQKNKGKTTELIFKAEDFEKCLWCDNRNFTNIESCASCKGTGYLIPKKDDVIDVRKSGTTEGYQDHTYWDMKFHLTSDAEVKNVRDCFTKKSLFNCVLPTSRVKFMAIHNLKEDSKIVIVEGYYE